MSESVPFEPVDYLVIGHVARDLTPDGVRLGGTAAYSALTARALGLRVGIVTASGSAVSLEPLSDIPLISITSNSSTTYENIYQEQGRVQYLRSHTQNASCHHDHARAGILDRLGDDPLTPVYELDPHVPLARRTGFQRNWQQAVIR